MTVHQGYTWLWKSSCQNKHKVFFWLLLKGRLSTRELLHRRNMQIQDYSCVFCPSTTDDSLEHLFIHCSFSRACWATIGLQVGDNGQFATLEQLKQQLGVPFFMDIIILKGIQPSYDACFMHFKKEFALVILRAKVRYKSQMSPSERSRDCPGATVIDAGGGLWSPCHERLVS